MTKNSLLILSLSICLAKQAASLGSSVGLNLFETIQATTKIEFRIFEREQNGQTAEKEFFKGSMYPKRRGNIETGIFFDAIAFLAENAATKFTLFNNRLYVSAVDFMKKKAVLTFCGSKTTTFPLFDLKESILSSRKVSGARNSECDTNDIIYQTFFAGESYLLCVNSNNFVHKVVGDSSVILLSASTTINNLLPIVAPLAVDGREVKCEQIQPPTHRRRSSLRSRKRNLKECGQCSYGYKKCVFIHGAGSSTEMPELQDEYEDYWGTKIADYSPCCSSIKFARFDTSRQSWVDEMLQQKYCNILTGNQSNSSNGGTPTIDDTIIISHSMSNLVLGLAFHTNLCRLSSSSKWVSIQGPMGGSLAADNMDSICDANSFEDILFSKSMRLVGMCPVQNSFKYFYWEGGVKSTNLGLNLKYQQAQQSFVNNVYAVMCGTSPFGLTSIYSPVLTYISSKGEHESADDGLVEKSSCMKGLPGSWFDDHYQSKFYLADINHVDGAFRNGNGAWGSDRKPLHWFNCLF